MEPRARKVGLGLVLLCLAGTLLVGLGVKSPCASGDWRDGRQYRRLCYSDIVPLYGTEQLTRTDDARYGIAGRLPFLDACQNRGGAECDEYPVLTMYAMRLAAWPVRTFPGFFYSNAVLLSAAAFAITLCLYLMVGSRALYFALAPTLAIYGLMNWDLLAVALATGATLAYMKRKNVAAGILLGLGTAGKLYPGLLLIPLVAGRFREREPDAGIHLVWAGAAAWLAVNLPFALLAPTGWWEFFRFNAQRAADWDSMWFLACRHLTGNLASCGRTGLVNVGSLAAFLAGAAVLWRWKRRRDPGFPRWTLGFPILVVFLLTNKVYSPQYGLWLLPWFALALPDLRLFAAFEAADVAVFVTRFKFFEGYSDLGSGMPFWAFEAAILIRAAILVWCLVAWVRREAEASPAPGEAAQPLEAGAPA